MRMQIEIEDLEGSRQYSDSDDQEVHEQERMLICQYMPNKSLLYLHKYQGSNFFFEEYQGSKLSRDLKASNILLDQNVNPKISDFGVGRMLTKQETEVVLCVGYSESLK
ncbi:tyrosine kinase family protein [Medicago truncatula]|uniref:Tyrosine kinase family protein n=1 Tax=Medicago truncatula TaxID=3880 RepID=G7ZX49_MEDTR|nr:tyrosine kinase family protein [Medicago truncatula]